MTKDVRDGAVSAVGCETCPVHHAGQLRKLGIRTESWDLVVALAGNPNTGKSTVFNALTGLRQHTGNWPGKTVTRAEGGFAYGGKRYKLVDLPGTYSLLSVSPDEEIARNFILFGRPDVTVVVTDSTRLERNLHLVLQVLAITDRVVVCLNLADEARRHGIEVDARRLARELGVPVVPTAARDGEGLPELLAAVDEVASGKVTSRPRRRQSEPRALAGAVSELAALVDSACPGLPNTHWVALRLLDGDERVAEALLSGELAELGAPGGPPQAGAPPAVSSSVLPPPSAESRRKSGTPAPADDVLRRAQELRWQVGSDFHGQLVEAIYSEAERIAQIVVTRRGEKPRFDLDRAIDRVVTSRALGFPVMLLLFTGIFWFTISGANVPSGWLSWLLVDTIHPALKQGAAALGFPWWLSGLVVDGVYLATAWVVSVMLPPMAIFFPLFTLLEDAGYLPRVAFNLDAAFKRAGAHGKQALSMMMGYGCNAAGVIATRIIDSPRERLVAVITNNFALCNGRWPTQILIATLFLGSLVPPYLAGLVSAAAVVGVAVFGVVLSFLVSWGLSRTVLRGQVSTFSLELPPYRPPSILRTIYTSIVDRTIYVLWRAVVFAVPAGAAIWLAANVHIAGASVAEHLIRFLDPLGILVGLNGVILLAYIVAIPANEIVIPTILMLTVLATGTSGVGPGAGVMFELDSEGELLGLLHRGGWTVLTAVNLMLFSLVHNPCSTTLYTIYKETGSARWTALSALLPIAMGFGLTFLLAQVWGLVAGA